MSKLQQVMQAGAAQAALNPPAPNLLTTPAHHLRRVGIVGASATGLSIAMDLIEADIPVTLFELGRASLDRATATARAAYAAAVTQGRLAGSARDRRMGLLACAVNFHHLKDCDLVIEAVSAEPGSKGELFRRLDQTVKQGAILLTCTSPARVEQLAACTRRMGQVLGLHLSRPAHAGQTWTLVPDKASDGQSLATLVALAQHLGKACVVAGSWSGETEQGGSSRSWQVEHVLE